MSLCIKNGLIYDAIHETPYVADLLIEDGKIDTTPLITHTYALKDIEEAYRIFENRLDRVIKVAIKTEE